MSVGETDLGAQVMGPAVPGAGPRRRGLSSSWVLVIAASWIALLLVIALVVQWLPLQSYKVVVGDPNMPPNLSREFLGTNDIGQSILSRLAYGLRVSMVISFCSTALAAIVGGALGLLAAYFRRTAGVLADVATSTVLAVPYLLLMLTIVLVFGTALVTLTLAIGVIFVPAFTRLMRINARLELSRDYIVAARALGTSQIRILVREVLPNTLPGLITYAVVVLPAIVIAEGSLSFLGFGVQPPTPSWGEMISLGSQNITSEPWPALIPCIALSLTVLSLNLVGDRLRQRLDLHDDS
jgi:peptide/nickel transport system permease protein